MRRILVAAAALAAATAVSGGLLAETAFAGGRDVFVLARDLPAGGAVTLDALRVDRVQAGDAGGLLLGPGEQAVVTRSVAAHDLRAGQLLERSDLASSAGATTDRRAVFVPLKDAPALAAGSRLDLLAVTAAADHSAVTPIASGVEVKALAPGGVVLLVRAREASALVYVAATQRIVAVVADPGATGGAEPAVSSLDEALEALKG